MVNGAFNFVAHTRDLGFQRGNARFQLIHGKRVKILLYQQNQRIIRTTREEVIKVHAQRVARRRHSVNIEA